MNWLRTILDGISICIALNGLVAARKIHRPAHGAGDRR